MSKNIVNEWYVDAPWGKIAMISWGSPENPPILLVHGYMDSAATFILLMDLLPDNHYYVGFDMPGHGKSSPFPEDLHITQLHVTEAIRIIVQHLQWKKFTYMSHSMGCIMGLIFHHLYPECVKKMIFLDPGLPLSMYLLSQYRPAFWFHLDYTNCFETCQEESNKTPRLYKYNSLVSSVARNRNLTEEQAKVVVSRSIEPMGNDIYRLTWEPRMKFIAQLTVPEETIYTIMTTSPPPILAIDPSHTGASYSKEYVENLMNKCELTLPHFYRVTVVGGHDVHITNPKLLVPIIVKFLESREKDLRIAFGKSRL